MQEKIVRYSSEELKAMRHLSLSNWEKLKNITDEDIDFSDFPELTDEQLARAKWPMLDKEKDEKISTSNENEILITLTPQIVEKIKSHKSWETILKTEIEELVANGVF